jgi:GxxExxY protein
LKVLENTISKTDLNSVSQKLVNQITFQVIGAAIEIHKEMGSGLLESIYHQCMIEELKDRGLSFKSEFKIPVTYKTKELNVDFRCDLFVEDTIVVELKAVQEILPIHEAQVLTYMKLLKSPKGVLINFNCDNIFRNGQKTFVNEYYRKLPEL